jgi:putative heme-binding domain-containing protein
MTTPIRRVHRTLPDNHFPMTRLQTLIGLFCFVSLGVLHGEPASDLIALKAAPGFIAEEVFVAGADDGSWSAMAVDPRGRLVISPQGSESMLRVTVSADGKASVERLAVQVTSAMGLLFAFDSLYVNGMGPQGFGLYRLRDTKNADAFDDVKLLRKFEGPVGGEHGSHGLVLGPDQRIYLVQGNHVLPPADASAISPFKNYAEDQLLPSANYGLSGGDKGKAPCGHILRMDANGREVEMFAGGFRNVYDLAFDARGELFAFDSDTEFNWGLPWYVPTRIVHVVSGGDYGFREGTGKWPAHFADSLPPVVNVGLGSPTGVRFGTASRFPEKYRRALFALDWTFGRILAVHLDARGASFAGRFENFVQGRPLNLTALEFGHDGAMYFITGGRKTRSALYRVRYTGEAGKEPANIGVERGVEARRALESMHGKVDAQAVSKSWPGLGSADRVVRHAARIALVSQPVAQWSALALSEEEPRTSLTALLALARLGNNEERAAVVARVAKWWPQLRDEELQLDAVRVASLALSRHGQPYPETKGELLSALDSSYPAQSQALNRELSQLLIALEAPRIVPRTLALLQAATTLEEQLHYVFHLRHQRSGWSTAERATYFRWFTQPHPADAHPAEVKQWFADVRLHYADGGSLTTYLNNIRNEAAGNLPDADRQELASLLEAPLLSTTQPVAVKPHQFVKDWQPDDLLPAVRTLAQPRSIENGREVFTAAACIACHRYANEGGVIGPDLTAVAYKLGAREMLESLIEPSKVISDQFQNTIVELTNGETRTGRIIEHGKDRIAISINPVGGDREVIPKASIRTLKPSPLSPMPPGLLNMFTQDDILDLLAYLGFGAP